MKMKTITSLIPRTFATLQKHVIPSPSPLRISKQKPMKRTIIRKHKHKKHTRKDLILNKVVSYLISDSYMYNSLVSPQPTFDFPPPKLLSTFAGGEGDVAVPIRGSNKKLIEKVVNFLEADCYLYSPLLNNNEHVCSMSRLATPNSGNVKTVGGRESTETEGGQTGELHPSPVVTETVAYRESLKRRVVRRNYGSNSIRGELLETDPRKLTVE
ncbi:hypothetical protein LXL04_002876 [Taraxacum kok-saghyz]